MLCEAAVDGSLEKVRMLLAHGADGTQGTTLYYTTLLILKALYYVQWHQRLVVLPPSCRRMFAALESCAILTAH
jgi:hypothetical protein